MTSMNSKWNGRTKGSTGGFRIRKNRLFSTKEAAEKQKQTPSQVVVIMDHLATKHLNKFII